MRNWIRWKKKYNRTSATRNHCCQKYLHTLQSVRLTIKGQNIPEKINVGYLKKKKHDLTFPTLKEVFNARNLDILRIHVKKKLFVVDVRRTQFRWLPKRPKMRKLSRKSRCYIKRLAKMKTWKRHCDPQIYRKDFIHRCLQTVTTFFGPIKGFICNCNTDPSSIFKTSSTLGQKDPTSNWLQDRDWVYEIYFELLPDTIGYIWWNCLRKSSSSKCTIFR